ncbi:N-acylneuraminate cytidylyltransferase [Bactrocera neohumeralis]|uniref:N-acylneuraminate cytidylyltransferase n=1 Tax=Bactrocera tryoni TaxID=59916 RepID=UPI001A980A4C|nr:N-acylneuraminate cytidylyltransferase [Bactrocera tryoni]XP_050337040.1 N-acylneuraminate cytidylyltransferase [Bactrocera neohumeralis]
MSVLHFFLFLYLQEYVLSLSSEKEVHALVLARGGSKGILNKNLKELEGISLLARTINVLNSSNLFQHIWVSTDSDSIVEEATKFGALVHKRDKIYAQDNTSSLESVKEFLQKHDNINRFGLFQCTSIFLKNQYIKEALNRFMTKDCVFAVTRSHKLRWLIREDEAVVPLNFNPTHRPRRQDWSGELIETGMFYFSTRHLVEVEQKFQNDKCGVVEIDAAEAMEIDTYTDLLVAECLIQNKTSCKIS